MGTIERFVRALSGKTPRINERGNRIFTGNADAERYIIDFADDFHSQGWRQYDTDQDASYFGVWTSRRLRMTLTYAEGDWSLVVCTTADDFNAEVAAMDAFYEAGAAFTTISDGGVVTRYYEDRASHRIPLLA